MAVIEGGMTILARLDGFVGLDIHNRKEQTMGKKGKMTVNRMGNNTPVHSPAYSAGPLYYYKGAEIMMFAYETDPEAAAALLPEPLTLIEPATVSVFIGTYPWSTVGSYKEMIQSIACQFGDEQYYFATNLILDNESPAFAGREVAGFGKKLGHVNFVHENDLVAAYVERPSGFRLCDAIIRPETPIETPPEGDVIKIVSMRAIPSVEAGKKFALLELVGLDWIQHPKGLWVGPGSINFSGVSEIDALHNLPVKKLVMCALAEMDFDLGNIKKLATIEQ